MKPKSWKRLAILGAIALAVIGGLVATTIFVVAPAVEYGKAGALLDKEDSAGAYDAFDRMGDYRDAKARKDQLQADILGTRSAENYAFGGYEWLIMEERDGKALLLMETTLETRRYHEELAEISWERCTLRTWLNGPFYNSFDEDDRARIVETAVINADNAENGTKAGNDTTDHIFLLSLAEAKLYFPSDAARVARNGRGASAYWWLRSPGADPILAATVGSDGKPGFAGSGVDYKTRDVRPALWVTKE